MGALKQQLQTLTQENRELQDIFEFLRSRPMGEVQVLVSCIRSGATKTNILERLPPNVRTAVSQEGDFTRRRDSVSSSKGTSSSGTADGIMSRASSSESVPQHTAATLLNMANQSHQPHSQPSNPVQIGRANVWTFTTCYQPRISLSITPAAVLECTDGARAVRLERTEQIPMFVTMTMTINKCTTMRIYCAWRIMVSSCSPCQMSEYRHSPRRLQRFYVPHYPTGISICCLMEA